jgi:hypothetical protein
MSAIIVIIIISLILAALLSSQMDKVSDATNYEYSIPAKLHLDRFWWCKELSYSNKYKNGDKSQGEKFFGSTTFLVWLTDGWHLLKFLFDRCWQLPISYLFYQGDILILIGIYIIIGVLFGTFFSIFYKWL